MEMWMARIKENKLEPIDIWAARVKEKYQSTRAPEGPVRRVALQDLGKKTKLNFKHERKVRQLAAKGQQPPHREEESKEENQEEEP